MVAGRLRLDEEAAVVLKGPSVIIRVQGPVGPRVVEVGGELDITGSAFVLRLLRDIIEMAREVVHVDLHSLRFVDATGIRALVLAARYARENERALVYCRPQSQVRRLLKLLDIQELAIENEFPRI
jgi:anti-anti-sigma factor